MEQTIEEYAARVMEVVTLPQLVTMGEFLGMLPREIIRNAMENGAEPADFRHDVDAIYKTFH